MADDQVRYAQILWETLEVLRDAPAPIPSREMVARVRDRLRPTPYESQENRSGHSRWETAMRFKSGDAATVGWMTKRRRLVDHRGWHRGAGNLPGADELWTELSTRYREIDQRRKQAQQDLSEVQQFIADTLAACRAGHVDRTRRSRQHWRGRTADRGRALPRQRSSPVDQRLPSTQRRRQHPAEGMLHCELPGSGSAASA